MAGHIKELLGQISSIGRPFLDIVRRLGSSWAAIFHVVAFSLSNSYFFRPLVRLLYENDFRKPPVNAERLEFVIKRRSASHSWRPSSRAATSSIVIGGRICLVPWLRVEKWAKGVSVFWVRLTASLLFPTASLHTPVGSTPLLCIPRRQLGWSSVRWS